ncbi:hypothetical protein [Pseudomonas sp. MF7448]|uniref:hypothetical protein n=1 Tax=Pseudomonas sp. MF7448 TaxID=2797537 RepID=UPI00190CD55C|nr:hypothetical protein [Pseudomonas sp. MF7448]MBK3439307.1 hypothetical protein [Pseudomonas sp. MF7448]
MNIPNGFKLVPAEPTEAMHDAARDWSTQRYGKAIGSDASRGCYSVMLAAAPTPPQPIFEEAKERELFGFWSSTHDYLGGCTLHTGTDGIYSDSDLQHAWESWLACAQSRAKAGEDE